MTNLAYRQSSGHLYFSIRDEGGLIRCVMFSRYVQSLPELPEEGALVLVRGAATLYERDGAFQLITYDIQPLGQGRGRRDLDALKRRLAEEGLFQGEHKRPLPRFPDAIGVITSPEGAALQDILHTFRRRGYSGRLILYPCAVQGAGAPASILRALEQLEGEGLCQAVIIARGGGSSEDLAAFNDEALAYGAYNCPVPVVSAVGHEIDYTILDLQMAEGVEQALMAFRQGRPFQDSMEDYIDQAVCPDDREALRQRVLGLQRSLSFRAREQIERRRTRLSQDLRLLASRSPGERVKRNRQKLVFLVRLLKDAQRGKLRELEGRALHLLRQLELLNPAAVMRKGYSVTLAEGRTLATVEGLRPGQELRTLLADGEVISTVCSFSRNEEKDGTEGNH